MRTVYLGHQDQGRHLLHPRQLHETHHLRNEPFHIGQVRCSGRQLPQLLLPGFYGPQLVGWVNILRQLLLEPHALLQEPSLALQPLLRVQDKESLHIFNTHWHRQSLRRFRLRQPILDHLRPNSPIQTVLPLPSNSKHPQRLHLLLCLLPAPHPVDLLRHRQLLFLQGL